MQHTTVRNGHARDTGDGSGGTNGWAARVGMLARVATPLVMLVPNLGGAGYK